MTAYSPQEALIHRREALKRVSALLGGAALIGGTALWTGCRPGEEKPGAPNAATGPGFSAAEVALLDEVADTILPTTSTPGAKTAQVGAFIALMVTDTYEPADQDIFRAGIKKLNEASQAANQKDFMGASPEQRLALLKTLDQEQKTYQDAKKKDDPNHYFRMMKELSLLGYFTSEIGMNQALRYIETPGRFDPCVPYTAGEKTWADHA